MREGVTVSIGWAVCLFGDVGVRGDVMGGYEVRGVVYFLLCVIWEEC